MEFKKILPFVASSLLLIGCGSDSGSDNDRNIGDPTPPAETPPTTETPAATPLYLVKSTAWVTKAGVSLHFITDSLNPETVFNPDTALSFQEYTGIAIPPGDNPDSAFYVGKITSGVLQRYTVNDAGVPSLDKEMDFSGVSPLKGRHLLRATQFMSATKAYALDAEGLQVIAFNPTTMTLIDIDPATEAVDTISLESIAEPTGTRWAVFPTTDGDRFVGTVGFYLPGGADPGLTKLVIVDSKNDSLVTDTINNCGAVTGAAKDAAGNMYFASYTEAALRNKVDPRAYEPCVVRVLQGAEEFDGTYLMNMKGLTNNSRMAAGAVTGNSNIAYNLVMSDAGEQFFTAVAAQAQTAEDPQAALAEAGKNAVSLPLWEYHSFDLTDDDAVATKVTGIQSHPLKTLPKELPASLNIAGGTIGRITTGSFTHHELGDITWMSHTDYERATSVYNATNPEGWTVISQAIPGQLEFVGRLR